MLIGLKCDVLDHKVDRNDAIEYNQYFYSELIFRLAKEYDISYHELSVRVDGQESIEKFKNYLYFHKFTSKCSLNQASFAEYSF